MAGHQGTADPLLDAALFRAFAAAAEGFVSCIDRQRRVLYLNRTLSRDIANVIGQLLENFVAPQHRQATIESVERAFERGEPESLEYGIVLDDGRRREIRTRFIPFAEPSGQPRMLLLTEDVTAHHELARELERSEDFRRRVIEQMPDFVILADREHRFVWVNRLAPGLNAADVIGSKVTEFNTAETREVVTQAIDAAFEHGTVGQFESEGYRDGVTKAWYLTRVVPILVDGKVDNVLMLTSDITGRKHAELALRETERQLHQSQRMESIGQLAGGIAHDFNNLLQVIQGNLHFAQQRIGQGVSAATEIDEALRATERAAELTSHLLAVGRRQRVDSKRVDVGALVGRCLRMLRRAIPESIQIDYQAPPQPQFAELDAPQFEQVLINLCVNARDAMPAGGTVKVRLAPEDATHLVLMVEDTGVGIPQENLSRIFEPFFTTKRSGSGLGLAVAAGIVAAHGGAIDAESDGQGTRMRIRLPRVEPEPAPTPRPAGQPPRGSGVILVAEDEAMVRVQVVRILNDAGYTVLQAENGARAVELFREHQGRVDLALLDVVMPVMDGWQAFLALRQLDPQLKALFTTGYAASVLPEDFASHGARVLSKPFKPAALLTVVRELLEGAAPSV